MKDTQRNSLIDIMKGIGIIAVVVGHLVPTIPFLGHNIRILQFVYTFHMALFFFCSGYLFKEKYLENPFGYIGNKVKGLYVPFVKYVWLYALTANVLGAMGILDIAGIGMSQSKYMNLGDILTIMINGFGFASPGMFLLAFWFIPVLFFSMCLFCFVLSKFEHYMLAGGIMSIVFGILGLYFAEKKSGFQFNLQTMFLIMPVIYVGFCVKRQWDKLEKYISIIASFVIAILLYILIVKKDQSIDLSRAWIISPFWFYIVTFSGIYMILGISKLLNKSKIVTSVFSYIGKNSLHIMAMHVFAIKIVDLIAVTFFGFPREELSKFVYSFDNLWPVYYVAGVAMPLGIHWLYENAVSIIKKQTKNIKKLSNL